GLERADRLAELLAVFHVVHSHLEQPARNAELHGGDGGCSAETRSCQIESLTAFRLDGKERPGGVLASYRLCFDVVSRQEARAARIDQQDEIGYVCIGNEGIGFKADSRDNVSLCDSRQPTLAKHVITVEL